MSVPAHPAPRTDLPSGVSIGARRAAVNDAWQDEDETAEAEDFRPLTREEAAVLRGKSPLVSPWETLAWQLATGVVLAVLVGGFAGKVNLGWSVLYGALSVVVPGALFARGLMSGMFSLNPGAAVAGFFLWEMVKVGLTIAMLFTAPRWVAELSWPAMMAGLVVTMKVVWLLLWLRARSNRQALIKRVD